MVLLAAVTLPAAAEDPAARAVQQERLQREQRQQELQLKMQQYHREARTPQADSGERRASGRLQLDQMQRQRQLHQEQQRELQGRPETPADDPGTRAAKAQIGEEGARRESEQQLRRFDWELQQRSAKDGNSARPAPQASPTN